MSNPLAGWTIRTGYAKNYIRKEKPIFRELKHLRKWLRTYRLYGYTSFSTKEIILQPYYLKRMTKAELNHVLLHEVAHALSKEGHTRKFARVCYKLGISAARVFQLKYYGRPR